MQIAWASVSLSPTGLPTALEAEMRRLGDAALRRYRSLDADAGRRFAVGRLLLAELIPALGTDAATIESRCDHCGGGDHGRPRVMGAPYEISVSYAGEMVVAAAVRLEAASALGIDIEASSTDIDVPLTELADLFSPRTAPSLRSWTEIEAVVKADGRGMRVSPADVSFGGPSAVLLPGGRAAGVPGNPGGFEVASAPGPAGHVVSVALAPASTPG
ncbi:MAG: hypothetical protein K0Q52_880 [Microbacterium sp.]|nr:hypothetical protein [Microbacterium sp.]